jgi:hypothetical protein
MAVAVEYVDVDTRLLGYAEAHAVLSWMGHALEHMHEPLEGIVGDIHRQTLAQFLSEGEALGDPWDKLADSTIADKAAHGYAFPEWPLVASGKLMDSATSSHGPYSRDGILEHEAMLELDWERDGWNIPLLHQLGVPRRLVTQHRHHKDGSEYTVSYLWHLPSRPFWEATEELADEGADRIVDWVMGPIL